MSTVRGVGVSAIAAVGTSVPGDLEGSSAAAQGASILAGWSQAHVQTVGAVCGIATLAWWSGPIFIPIPATGAVVGASVVEGRPPRLAPAVGDVDGISYAFGVPPLGLDDTTSVGSWPVASAPVAGN